MASGYGMRPTGCGFSGRTAVFAGVAAALYGFVAVCFVTGADNGGWVARAAHDVMGVTLMPLARAAEAAAGGGTLGTLASGVTRMLGMDGPAIAMAVAVVALAASLAYALVASLVLTVRSAGDEGSVALVRGHEERYDMYRRLG